MKNIIIGLLIPFAGTIVGSSMVLLLKNEIKPLLQKALLGFASGVMMAASVWSLLLPSIENSEQAGYIPWLPAAVGFILGMAFLLIIDSLVPHLHRKSDNSEGLHSRAKKNTMLLLAVIIHNIPEGMAVGVVYAALLEDVGNFSLTTALALSLGIALQNLPEGAIISFPLKGAGTSKEKAFLLGTLSGVVEPIASALTVLFLHLAIPALPFLLSFAAGAMIYVVVEELIPEINNGEHSNIGLVGVCAGFVIMMVLDLAFG
ncbi:MAG: Zinc transporter ZupT [Firmicutes bacterium ADurb.Bin300]|nr:MAG: Zinc transporter ZupT [Firmicutes bacterium ADurb.Bin300]HOD02428.1 ZIP family metal transporter [Clostridiales bacterium]